MNKRDENTRRYFFRSAAVLGTSLVLDGCGGKGAIESRPDDQAPASKAGSKTDTEVTAVEDLMREHGVLRRVLFVYSEAAAKLRQEPTKSISEPLHEAAKLFRDFGENYHEKALEEAYIFPALSKTSGEASKYPE